MNRVERAFLLAYAAVALWVGSWQAAAITGILAAVGIVLEVLQRDSRALRDLGPELARMRDLYARLANRPEPPRSPK